MRCEWLVLLGATSLGCNFHPNLPDEAQRRAAMELTCPQSKISVVRLPELSGGTFEAHGCDRKVRYSCHWFGNYDPSPECVPEAAPNIKADQ